MGENKESGFTLLEILLAIMVLSIMMMLVYDMSSNSTETVERVMSEDREYMQVQTAFAIIDRDFSLLYTPLFTEVRKQGSTGDNEDTEANGERFDGTTHLGKSIPIIDNQEKFELIFMTSSHQRRLADIKQSNYAWVRYTLRSKEKTQRNDGKEEYGDYQLIRQYSATNPYEKSFEWEDIKSNVLLKNVKQLQFFFWDFSKEEYVESYKDLPSEQRVVRLIKAELVWVNQNGHEIEANRSFRALWPPYDASKEIKSALSAEKDEDFSNENAIDKETESEDEDDS